MENLAKYQNDNPVSTTRRFCALAIDALILIVISFVLIISSYQIVANIDSYKTAETRLNQEMIACYKLQEESKVYEYLGEGDQKYNSPRQQADIFKDYCLSHILYSQQKDPEPFKTYNVTIKNEKNLPVASYEVDPLAYFYAYFVPKYNEYNGNKYDIIEYEGDSRLLFYNQYKKIAFQTNMWVFNEETLELPYLKGAQAADLYKYLFEDKSYQAGLTVYNFLSTNFQKIWRIEVNQLLESQRYKDHYDIYKANYEKCSYIIDTTIAIDYVIAFALVMVLPQIIFRNCRTFGKKLMQITVVDKQGYDLQIWQIIVRNILLFFVMFGCLVASCFLAGGTGSGWMYPLFEIGTIGVSLFTIMVILLIIGIISFVVGVFTPKKQSIHDLICQTYSIDDRYHQDIQDVYQMQKELEQKEVENEKFIDLDKNQYFDSSSFNNTEREDLTKKD